MIHEEPASIKHLSKLKELDIDGCTRLCHLPELPPSITRLYANNCSSLETVMFTSRAAELLQGYDEIQIQFQNCGKLDERSLSAIGVNTHANIKKFAYEKLLTRGSRLLRAEVIYPGSEVPEWFMYRTTQASLTVDLSSAPPSKFMGFILCAIIVGSTPSVDIKYIRCRTNLEIGNGERVMYKLRHHDFFISGGKFLSDHVCLWYEDGHLLQDRVFDNETMEEVMACCNPKLSFKMFAQSPINWETLEEITIKGCEVCPIYDTEYSNFIKQMELESESTLQSIATEKSTFPPLQIGTWKSATQGLKDILLL